MKMTEAFLKKRGGIFFGVFLCLLLAYPLLHRLHSLAIVGGDQSQYAEAAVDLYRAWGEGFGAGLVEMISSMKFKPPILPWTGQFLLPFHKVRFIRKKSV